MDYINLSDTNFSVDNKILNSQLVKIIFTKNLKTLLKILYKK